MRIFLIFLLVLNLVYGLWQFYLPVSQEEMLPEMPKGLKSLQLLSELESADIKLDEHSVIATKQPISSTEACFTLGPFKDKGLSDKAMAMLKGKVKNLEHRTLEENEQHRYWVYIPSLQSRAEAIAKSKELAKKKIKDYYIIQSGSKNNGISLGNFKEKGHAYRRLESLKGMGFEVEIEPIYHTYTVHWLDYQLVGEQSVEKEILLEFQDDGVARLNRPCEE
ncbi:MAG: SPOR domain-containing protein [Gammaproteobacteria bacterium]